MIIQGFGGVQKAGKKFSISFYDVIEEKSLVIPGYFDTEIEAKKELGFIQYEYYKNRTRLLPKGVHVNNRGSKDGGVLFMLSLSIPYSSSVLKKKPIYLGYYTTIQDALKVKFELFNLNS